MTAITSLRIVVGLRRVSRHGIGELEDSMNTQALMDEIERLEVINADLLAALKREAPQLRRARGDLWCSRCWGYVAKMGGHKADCPHAAIVKAEVA